MPHQFGFRSGHDTSQPLIRNLIKNNLNIGKSTNIKTAFDSVWYNRLIFKLKQFNFLLEIIKIVNNFLQNPSFNANFGKTR